MPSPIQNRENGRSTLRDDRHNITQRSININMRIFVLYQVPGFHQSKYCLIVIVSDQRTIHSNTLGIDRILLKNPGHPIRDRRSNNQRSKELVPAADLSNEENGSHRSLHHTCHHRSHPHKSKILLRNGNRAARKEKIEHPGNKKSQYRPFKQRGSECTSDSASGVSEGHRHYFYEEYQYEDERKAPGKAVKQSKQR